MNILNSKPVAETLAVLHEKAAADHQDRQAARQQAANQGKPFEHAWATAYMAVGAEEGRLLHLLARVARSKNIVEFGCSYGISTIYLAAAAKANGGRLITTDIEPTKIAGARQNIDEAGLLDVVTLLEGNALETLATVEGEIDFLFLDGAKELYLPVFELLEDKLAAGAIIIADNADKAETHPLVNRLAADTDRFSTTHLFEGRAFIAYSTH
ncbi:methyltransferase domain-containing protein [Mucilaginibacter robiniae]|uniref:Methyltransferase domain-containing protein n=1 Tax=Mucilaginibacter robiniae TaxID=2728022 RepID=A0A7L5E1N3_9SPHI|nr:class I SAM-dependent methyltransferase [Mucilaginibacter robiniae]QJD96219.1 methyltransferase domain-containing protein [Mucilaginibacter robiniae]